MSAKQALANGVRCAYKRYQQTRNINFQKADLTRLKELKLIENENLNKFYGICFNQQNEFLVLWILCQRGSLEDVLFNEELKISRNFQVSFAKDVVKVGKRSKTWLIHNFLGHSLSPHRLGNQIPRLFMFTKLSSRLELVRETHKFCDRRVDLRQNAPQ